MRIAVIGTGVVGRSLAAGFAAAGHDVVVGTRDPAETASREEWSGTKLPLVALGEAGDGAELVVNATSGQASLSALERVGRALDGVVLLDVANPLDSSAGFPPTLTVKDTDSLAEQIQRAFPAARVVKSLNTVNAGVMLKPIPGSTMFVAGDDPDARRTVADLLRSFGWEDVIEFASLDGARGMEMWLPLWVRLTATLGTAEFNLKIIR